MSASSQRQIFFLAAHPGAIQGVRAGLRRLCPDWSVEVFASSAEVIARLAPSRSDIVFAESQLSKEAGIDALDAVWQAHPQVLRVLCAPAPDQDLMMRCVWNSHRLLTLPPIPEVIRDGVLRALEVEPWLANRGVQKLVANMRTFPTMPTLYFRVLRELESPNAAIERISELICNDLAISTKIIQVVNSAFYGWQRQITDLSEAVNILGLETIKSLVLAIQALAQLEQVKQLHFSTERIWRHGLTVANLAKQVAQFETDDSTLAEEAYTAGLLHDIGKLVLAQNLGDTYNRSVAAALQHQVHLPEIEAEQFGATHADTAAYLVALWGLPRRVVEAIALHHTPERSADAAFSPLTAVHVANVLEHERLPDKDGLLNADYDLAYLARLRLSDQIEVWRQTIGDRKSPRRSRTAPPPPVEVEAPRATPRVRWRWPKPVKPSPGFAVALVAFSTLGVVLSCLFEYVAAQRPAPRRAVARTIPVALETQVDPEPASPAAEPGVATEQPPAASAKPMTNNPAPARGIGATMSLRRLQAPARATEALINTSPGSPAEPTPGTP